MTYFPFCFACVSLSIENLQDSRTNDLLLCILISVASLLDRCSTLSKPERECEWILSEPPVLFPDQPRYGSNLSETETSVSSLGFPISWWNPTVEQKSSFEKRRLAVCSGQWSKVNAVSFSLADQNEPKPQAPIVCRESRSRWLYRFEYLPSDTFKRHFPSFSLINIRAGGVA